MKKDPSAELKAVLSRARRSARSRNLTIEVDLEFLRSLWEAQQGCCAVSGLAFTDEQHEEAFVKTPFAPSLDRIDSSKGYMKGNARLVCMAANFALNQWGDEVLRRLAHGVVEKEREVHRAWFRDRRRKLRDAEKAGETMAGEGLARQRRVIAGLKRALTMGPARLGAAALKAQRSADKLAPRASRGQGGVIRACSSSGLGWVSTNPAHVGS